VLFTRFFSRQRLRNGHMFVCRTGDSVDISTSGSAAFNLKLLSPGYKTGYNSFDYETAAVSNLSCMV
jgi:hypothetical protein